MKLTYPNSTPCFARPTAKLQEVFGKSKDHGNKHHDLDSNASILILVDSINPKIKPEKADRKPFASLKQALVRHLSNTVPSLAIKTGFSSKEKLGSSSKKSLDIVSARAQSG